MRFQRGAVFIETALTVGVGLTILVFSIQVGVLGFLQTTADAAAFVDAHGHAIGTLDPLGADHATAVIFPQVLAADITSSPQPAPSVSFPVDYGFNTGKVGNLHAGVSMLEPLLSTSTVKPHGTQSFLGQAIGVIGQAIEPHWVECGPHYNVSQSNLQCGSAGTPTNFSVDYFANGENTPPYYVGFNFRPHCTLPQPWTKCQSVSGSYNFLALGVGEFLDVNNWNASSAGASGTGKSGTQPVSSFEYMACHQRVYANLSTFLATMPTISAIYTAFTLAYNKQVTGKSGGISDFRNWNEFSATAGTVSTADGYVREIYNWDAQVAAGAALNPNGEPGATPLHPDTGC